MDASGADFFREATLRICGSLNIEAATVRCYHFLKEHLPMSGLVLQLYEPDSNSTYSLISIRKGQVQSVNQTIHLPESARALSRASWSRLPERFVENHLEGSYFENYFRVAWQLRKTDSACLFIRLELDGKKLGILGVFHDQPNTYTDLHGELLRSLHEPFAIAVSNLLRYQEVVRLKDILAGDNKFLRQELFDISQHKIVGDSNGLKHVMDAVRLISPLDTSVLLLGETGVGKEVIANAIHDFSPRKSGPLIKINCGAVPESLLDSELFGHEKGAFTGAVAQTPGRFERAHTGTLFLDEIGELSASAQVKLLRVLQEKEFERIGGTRVIKVDVRVIAATHRNPEEMVKNGTFREDLLYRINTFPIWIPPLRERKEDIPLLADHFIKQKSKDMKIMSAPSLAPETIHQFRNYHWPGNVRELENMIERALIRFRGGLYADVLTLEDFGTPFQKTSLRQGIRVPHDENVFHTLDNANKIHISRALDKTGGRIFGPRGAAALLGVNPNTLRSRMRKLEIPFRFR